MVYDYREAVKEDVKEYIINNYDLEEAEELQDDYDSLYDDLFIEDSVTGNASGSYTFSTWKAEENIAHNLDLLQDALECFGCDASYLEKGAEACDVTIRCYLLGEVIEEAIEEAIEQLQEEKENEEA